MKLSKISLVTLLTLSGAIAQEGGTITGEAKYFMTTDGVL